MLYLWLHKKSHSLSSRVSAWSYLWLHKEIRSYSSRLPTCYFFPIVGQLSTGSHSPRIHRTEPTEIFLALTQTCVLFITRHFSDTPNRKFIGLSRVFHRPMIYLSHNRVSPSFAQPLESYDRAYDRLAINSRAGALPDQSGTVSECPC